ncbi:unnamed protein product [Chrysoparadoxa australica]
METLRQWCADLEWIGSSTLLLATPGSPLDLFFVNLADQVGMDVGTIKYVSLMLAAYPMGYLFSRAPASPSMKHFMSFLGGAWMMQFIFASQWIHSFITSVATYFLVTSLPNRIMPYAVFVFVMGYMCASHTYRMYVDYMGWSLDFTGPQMVLTMKLTAYAFNVYDGRMLETLADTGNARTDKVKRRRRRCAVVESPGILAFLGYSLCFSTILAGPTFEFVVYESAVTGRAFTRKDGTKAMPGNVAAALSRLAVGLACLAFFQALSPLYPLADVASSEALALPFYYRFAVTWVTLAICRQKYYFAWKVAEGGAVMAGHGFEGFNAEGKSTGWGGISNIDILEFEFAQNLTANSRAWNKGTQSWLERYIYSRSGNSLMAVYFVSAFWHGFYPGYYMFFLSVPLATCTARAARMKVRPYFLNADGSGRGVWKKLYDAASMVVDSVVLCYLVIPFVLLSWEKSHLVWSSYGYGVHLAIILWYAICTYVIPKKARVDAVKTPSRPSVVKTLSQSPKEGLIQMPLGEGQGKEVAPSRALFTSSSPQVDKKLQ